jgi:hypothetical protein
MHSKQEKGKEMIQCLSVINVELTLMNQ